MERGKSEADTMKETSVGSTCQENTISYRRIARLNVGKSRLGEYEAYIHSKSINVLISFIFDDRATTMSICSYMQSLEDDLDTVVQRYQLVLCFRREIATVLLLHSVHKRGRSAKL